ncbi:MAG: CDP-diacylglycerol O-phosphatidyltransferase [Bacteroidota bacterium]|jgi:CDP-diacylglycerol--serine O-phosphatidyltransferase|nr:CDP-diacylglycerol O-phosphatidyltransferase [Bacteroidota bacterium]
MKKHIPNAITCGNLFCGCLAIVSAFEGNLIWSAYLVGIAAVLDFFDGFVARLLHVGGELGKQLDSLADMVTFGVVPGVVMFQLLRLSELFNNIHDVKEEDYLSFAAFIITIFSALRLAKFNIDTRQTNSFIGVPTPANAILICSLPLILYHNFDFKAVGGNFTFLDSEMLIMDSFSENKTVSFILNKGFLLGLTGVMSYLLIAELPLFALKFKNFGWPDNKLRYTFLIISVILLILFQFIAIPFIIFLYIILSVVNNTMDKRNQITKN